MLCGTFPDFVNHTDRSPHHSKIPTRSFRLQILTKGCAPFLGVQNFFYHVDERAYHGLSVHFSVCWVIFYLWSVAHARQTKKIWHVYCAELTQCSPENINFRLFDPFCARTMNEMPLNRTQSPHIYVFISFSCRCRCDYCSLPDNQRENKENVRFQSETIRPLIAAYRVLATKRAQFELFECNCRVSHGHVHIDDDATVRYSPMGSITFTSASISFWKKLFANACACIFCGFSSGLRHTFLFRNFNGFSAGATHVEREKCVHKCKRFTETGELKIHFRCCCWR